MPPGCVYRTPPIHNNTPTTPLPHAGSQFQNSNIGNGATVDAAIWTSIPSHLPQQSIPPPVSRFIFWAMDVPLFSFGRINCHEEIPSVWHVLTQKARVYGVIPMAWNASSPAHHSITLCMKQMMKSTVVHNASTHYSNANACIVPAVTADASLTPIFNNQSVNNALSLVYHVTSNYHCKEDLMIWRRSLHLLPKTRNIRQSHSFVRGRFHFPRILVMPMDFTLPNVWSLTGLLWQVDRKDVIQLMEQRILILFLGSWCWKESAHPSACLPLTA